MDDALVHQNTDEVIWVPESLPGGAAGHHTDRERFGLRTLRFKIPVQRPASPLGRAFLRQSIDR